MTDSDLDKVQQALDCSTSRVVRKVALAALERLKGRLSGVEGDHPSAPSGDPLAPLRQSLPSPDAGAGLALECACPARKALKRIAPYFNHGCHLHLPDGTVFNPSDVDAALAAPCECAGLRDEVARQKAQARDVRESAALFVSACEEIKELRKGPLYCALRAALEKSRAGAAPKATVAPAVKHEPSTSEASDGSTPFTGGTA